MAPGWRAALRRCGRAKGSIRGEITMCGFIAVRSAGADLRLDRVHAALATIEHRGPDATRAWISEDGLTALGHVRLSIIGLDNGDQPLIDASGDVRAVVNGELYGYRTQREQLRAAGHDFATDSDSARSIRDQAAVLCHPRRPGPVRLGDQGAVGHGRAGSTQRDGLSPGAVHAPSSSSTGTPATRTPPRSRPTTDQRPKSSTGSAPCCETPCASAS